ncbi:PucR family transcriptional regulator [Ammoniphilus sp. CFH 90114]|uniref:PucR family transcriptional regulator n=1 Tax=Ammoniphilus sp. CFH 90114 TaxID=2493665 RepID=UPI00100FCAD9|nr:PucR family transcriptional regulator [Ammoniphilus sp. CFH 90114]RXT04288.1 PucR family transcriptional regulator [Ammoniphilus sp. CFH 90114]
MGITIQEALRLPVMSDTKLVAGWDGLTNIIKWVTIVEVIDDISRFQEGEFLITTGFGLLDNEHKRMQFQTLLSSRMLSGVAIYTGFYLHEIPEPFIAAANEAGLPIIEIPTNINFSMLTRAILEQIVNKQMKLYEYSLNIHKEFNRLVLVNQGLEPITRTLSELIRGSVLLLGEDGNLMDHLLIHEGIELDNLELSDDRLRLESYPIVANEVRYGTILAVKESVDWNDLDHIAMEHAATVYAVEFLKQKAVEDTEIRLQGDFLDEILNKNFKNAALAMERGKRLGYDLTLNQAVMHFKADTNHERLYLLVQQVMRERNRQFILRNKLDGLVVLTDIVESLGQTARVYLLDLAREVESLWKEYFPRSPLRIGIGRNYRDIQYLAKSAREAQYAVTFSRLLLKPKTIVHYDDLGLYHLLIQMKELGVDLKEFYEANLGNLISMKRQGVDLIMTLETYLLNNQSIHTTASELYIHRHTLKYRLNQIEKKTGLDLASADDRMKLQLAIMAYKLLNTGE